LETCDFNALLAPDEELVPQLNKRIFSRYFGSAFFKLIFPKNPMAYSLLF
jgi:hypothetical protein